MMVMSGGEVAKPCGEGGLTAWLLDQRDAEARGTNQFTIAELIGGCQSE